MLGSALLVKPVHQAGVSQTSVYLPALAADAATSEKGTVTTLWYDFWQHGIVTVPGSEASSSSGLQHSVSVGRDRIPVFQLGGTVVATRERVRRSSTAMRGDPITLLVCVDASGEASGQIFMDDESTFGYRDGGMAFGNITVTPQGLSYKAVVKPSEARIHWRPKSESKLLYVALYGTLNGSIFKRPEPPGDPPRSALCSLLIFAASVVTLSNPSKN